METTWLDELIGFFSPHAKTKRLMAKITAEHLNKTSKRGYDAASRGRRTKGWKASNGSPNNEIWRALGLLRARSRELVRNDAYASNAINVIASEVVGSAGVIGQVKSSSISRANRFNDLWREWTETTACDFDGVNTLAGLQKMVMRSMAEGGDCLARVRFVEPDRPGLPPIKIQVLEGDFLDDRRINFSGVLAPENKVVLGVEFDPQGRRVQYHLYGSHPGSLSREIVRSNILSTPFPASQVAHIFRPERTGGVRGIPWLASTMLRMKDFSDFEDAQLLRQKLAACHVAFIKDLEAPETGVSEEDDDLLGAKLEPGIYEFLPPGKDVVFNNPPGTSNYGEYTSTQLHAIAAGIGISFEALTGNLSQVNFSSARMGKLRMNRNVDTWTRQILIPQFLDRAFNWWRDSLTLTGSNPRDISMSWTPPKKELVDPTKEVPAIIKSIRAGITTLSDTIRTQGGDPSKVLAEYAEDIKTLDELGLSLDTDVRKVNQLGSSQPSNEEGDPPSDGGDAED